jgi:DNA-directed RNA polymerase subunit beta'
VDHLLGLKENVIMGHLIPAGTGLKHFRNIIPVITDGDEVTPIGHEHEGVAESGRSTLTEKATS